MQTFCGLLEIEKLIAKIWSMGTAYTIKISKKEKKLKLDGIWPRDPHIKHSKF